MVGFLVVYYPEIWPPAHATAKLNSFHADMVTAYRNATEATSLLDELYTEK